MAALCALVASAALSLLALAPAGALGATVTAPPSSADPGGGAQAPGATTAPAAKKSPPAAQRTAPAATTTAPAAKTTPPAAKTPAATTPPATTPAAPAAASTGATTTLTPSAAGTPGAQPTSTVPGSPPATGTTAPAKQAGKGGGVSGWAILAAVIGALIALACLVWAVFRFGAFEPHWLQSLRHSVAEAGYRASATWAEFTDWVRLGH
jgi:hypothetical protein